MAPKPPEKIKILCVDDEEVVHEALDVTLRREPYDLVHAFDAGEALFVLEQHPEIRGVICDHSMPGVEGIDLLVRLRMRRPDLVTLLLTGNASMALAKRAVNESHVHGFMTKPWKSAELRDLLRRLLLDEGVEALHAQVASTERRLRAGAEPERETDTGAYILDLD